MLGPLTAAVIAAILYGTGAALQQHQASAAPDGSAGRPSLLLLLMRRPWWLLGLATEQAGFAAHAVALRSGPLMIVQMLLASSLVFSVATVRLWSRRPLGRSAWVACAAVVAGIGAFVALTSRSDLSGSAGSSGLPRDAALAAAALGVSALPLAAAGLAAAGRRRVILLAVAAGLADACMAVVTMAFARTVPHGPAEVFTTWPLYTLVAAGFCSFLLTQTAYQAGTPMITLPVIAVVTPMSSLAAGAGLLGEAPHLNPARAAALGLAVLVTAAGLATLARRTQPPPAASPTFPSTWPAPSLTRPAFSPTRPDLSPTRPDLSPSAPAGRPRSVSHTNRHIPPITPGCSGGLERSWAVTSQMRSNPTLRGAGRAGCRNADRCAAGGPGAVHDRGSFAGITGSNDP